MLRIEVLGGIILLNIFRLTFAYFETCDRVSNVLLAETVTSPYFPASFVPGSSCRHRLVAPSEATKIQLTCTIQIARNSSGQCQDAHFYVATDGDTDVASAEFFCGTGVITRTSLFREIMIAYTSSHSTSASGSFICIAAVIPVLSCDCGWSVNSRILNGADATPNKFTSLVGLVSTSSRSIFCGGTIISPTMVLTAANCLNNVTPATVVIVAGEHDVTIGTIQRTETPYTQLYASKRFIIHSSYSASTNQNDIALIETTSQIVYKRGVGPACLPFSYTNQSFEGSIVEAAGWGATSFGGPVSNTVKDVSLNVISNSQCTLSIPQIFSSQMCTFTATKDICQGDNGGPLYFRQNRLFLVGVISYGSGCGSTIPSVNTRVTSYLNWISQNVNPAALCRK